MRYILCSFLLLNILACGSDKKEKNSTQSNPTQFNLDDQKRWLVMDASCGSNLFAPEDLVSLEVFFANGVLVLINKSDDQSTFGLNCKSATVFNRNIVSFENSPQINKFREVSEVWASKKKTECEGYDSEPVENIETLEGRSMTVKIEKRGTLRDVLYMDISGHEDCAESMVAVLKRI